MVTAYPVQGKAKSLEICRAFVDGCRGTLALDVPQTLYPGAALFYGVDESNRHLWEQVRREGREFYYCDNSYFDATRQTYFRVTKNRIQHEGLGSSDARRFLSLGIEVRDVQRNEGGHIVFCPQSDWFMRVIVAYPGAERSGAWLRDALAEFARIAPERQRRAREWIPDKTKLARSLPEDLIGAWALVTHSSAAAITALLSGIPVFCSDACAAMPLSSVVLDNVPHPIHYSVDARRCLAAVLADNQWTLDEMRSGMAWAALQ